MTRHARPWAPLALALGLLSLCLMACQAPSSDDARGKSIPIAISSAVRGTSSATQSLPPLTIGVWSSGEAPDTPTPDAHTPAPRVAGTHQSISLTIYVLCMLQDQAHGGVIGPAAGLSVRVRLSGPITQSYTSTTGRDGLAQVHVTFTDTQPNKPVTVAVVTTWHGVTYQGQTFLILGDQGTPSPSPSPSVSPSPMISPTTETVPTATTAPDPTSTPQPTTTTALEPTATTSP